MATMILKLEIDPVTKKKNVLVKLDSDSDANAEWTETQSKARAILRAAEMAEHGLDTRTE